MRWVGGAETIDNALAMAPSAPPAAPSFWDTMGQAIARGDEAMLEGTKPIGAVVGTAADEIGSPGFLDSAARNISATWDESINVDNTNADNNAMYDAFQNVVDAVNRDRPDEAKLVNPMVASNVGTFWRTVYNQGRAAIMLDTTRQDELEARLWRAVQDMKRTNPGLAANLPADKGQLIQAMQNAQRAAAARAESVRGESGPVARTVGGLVGGGAASFTDPVNIAAMGFGAPASASLLRTFIIEGLLNASADAVTLPGRIERRSNLGLQAPDAGDVAAELTGDVLFGGGMGAGLKGLGRMLGLVEHFDARFPEPGDDAHAARNAVAEMARREADNPYTPTEEGLDEFRRNLDAVTWAIDNRQPIEGVSRGWADYEAQRGAIARDVTALRTELQSLPPNDPAALEKFARLQAVEAQLEGQDFATPDVKALRQRRDEILTNTTLEALAEAASTAEHRRVLTAQIERAGESLAQLETDYRAAQLFRPLREGDQGLPHANQTLVIPIAHPEDPATFGRRLTESEVQDAVRFANPEDRTVLDAQTKSLAAEMVAPPAEMPAPDPDVRVTGSGVHGPILEGYKGRWKEAVAWLRKARTGDAIGVLSHPDVPGPIDVIWGNRDAGLAKIVASHPEVLNDLPERLAKMKPFRSGPNRIELETGKGDGSTAAIVRLDFDNVRKTWLLTAFERGSRSPAGLTEGGRSFGGPDRGSPGQPAEPIVGAQTESLKSEFGHAADEIANLRSLPQDSEVPAMDHLDLYGKDGGPVTIRRVTLETEREARAIERLRACLEGGD